MTNNAIVQLHCHAQIGQTSRTANLGCKLLVVF